ncbi:hypothetical protein RB2050 [Rhodopirellula baltica SH 1]|uniref:Uncharacterized protein n=1 Tax=Rhodopirellula baltica (strain DSM 10527 / NCIMB 13988 / SH1) TaxID=243090 RepID=Q7UWG7_RHOBA|nr:hypothetical protein RB2050 [Rhodopirellula baltica SH 1]
MFSRCFERRNFIDQTERQTHCQLNAFSIGSEHVGFLWMNLFQRREP